LSEPDNTNAESTFEPRLPTLLATGICSLWIFILSLPMWTGKFLGSTFSDQYTAGYGFRTWAAEQWKTTGKVPLWNPEILGGMPFVAGMTGDIFYPTAWLRLILPIDVAMNIGFAAHYVLAGLLAYLFLRRLHVSWAGSVVGGVVYQLSGVVASYVNPGHDGKLFVTALFPLALLSLLMALRDKKWEGYALLALSVGLGFLSPHPQMLYYMLVATGLFALFLTFGDETTEPLQPRIVRLAVSLAAVFVGFGIGAIQMVPFYYYIPFSPRAESIGSWERAISYAIPWEHLPEFFLARFAGQVTVDGTTYWGSNGFKLHSEYWGLPAAALAILGATGAGRRRLKWWLAGIAALFMLVALGGSTPFYRLWYAVMPFMKQVRAAGMAFYIPSFVVAVFAALGVDRLLRREGKKHVQIWLGAGAGIALLALIGAFGGLAEALAGSVQARLPGYPAIQRATEAGDAIRWGAFGSAVALTAAGGVAFGLLRNKLSTKAALLMLIGVVGTDLWWNAGTFWNFSDAPDVLFAGDEITRDLQLTEPPYRVWQKGVYGGAILMAYGIPELIGHHGNELDAFDKLLNRQAPGLSYPNEIHPTVWDLYAVQKIILPQQRSPDSIPGFTRSRTNVPTAAGIRAAVFERTEPVPYARIVGAASKLPEDQLVPTVLHPRFPLDRVVAVDTTAHFDPPELTAIPDSVETSVSVTEWAPGRMRLEISPAAPQDAFVVISENWYFDWQATVDGQPVTPIRGNGALLTVPVRAGAREIELRFESDAYRRGKGITLASLLLVAVGFVTPVALRRKKRA
jgi:hypothetical protein